MSLNFDKKRVHNRNQFSRFTDFQTWIIMTIQPKLIIARWLQQNKKDDYY